MISSSESANDDNAKPARILYVTDSVMAGGIESQLVELVTRLDRSRYTPSILCLYGERTRGLHFAQQISDAGIPMRILDIGWTAFDKVRATFEIIATVRRLQPDLVQAENYHSNLLTRLARPFMPQRTKLIGTVRGVETPKQLFYQRLSSWLCSRLVASGPQLKHALVAQAGVPDAHVVVIPNAVDVRRFAAPRDVTSRASDLRQALAPNGERVFISVGRICKQKSMHLLAEALGILKRQSRLSANVRLCILGQVEDGEMQAKLEDAIRRNEVAEVIIQHRETHHPEDYYWASDASILFTRLEGISIAMLESLAAGRPVLSSEEANAAEVIAEGVTGWVARTGDVEHLAEVLAGVIALPDEALAAMRPACQARAEHYSVERLVERYSAFYDDLLATGTLTIKR